MVYHNRGGRQLLLSPMVRWLQKMISLTENRYGLIIQGKDSSVTLTGSKVEKNDYGLLLLNDAQLTRQDSTISGNSKKDEFLAGSSASSFPTRKLQVLRTR